MSEEKKVLLEVKNLKKYFTVETDFFGKPKAVLKAVDATRATTSPGWTEKLTSSSAGRSAPG